MNDDIRNFIGGHSNTPVIYLSIPLLPSVYRGVIRDFLARVPNLTIVNLSNDDISSDLKDQSNVQVLSFTDHVYKKLYPGFEILSSGNVRTYINLDTVQIANSQTTKNTALLWADKIGHTSLCVFIEKYGLDYLRYCALYYQLLDTLRQGLYLFSPSEINERVSAVGKYIEKNSILSAIESVDMLLAERNLVDPGLLISTATMMNVKRADESPDRTLFFSAGSADQLKLTYMLSRLIYASPTIFVSDILSEGYNAWVKEPLAMSIIKMLSSSSHILKTSLGIYIHPLNYGDERYTGAFADEYYKKIYAIKNKSPVLIHSSMHPLYDDLNNEIKLRLPHLYSFYSANSLVQADYTAHIAADLTKNAIRRMGIIAPSFNDYDSIYIAIKMIGQGFNLPNAEKVLGRGNTYVVYMIMRRIAEELESQEEERLKNILKPKTYKRLEDLCLSIDADERKKLTLSKAANLVNLHLLTELFPNIRNSYIDKRYCDSISYHLYRLAEWEVARSLKASHVLNNLFTSNGNYDDKRMNVFFYDFKDLKSSQEMPLYNVLLKPNYYVDRQSGSLARMAHLFYTGSKVFFLSYCDTDNMLVNKSIFKNVNSISSYLNTMRGMMNRTY